MANRVTEDEVKAVIDYDTTITSLDAFITAANQLVTEVCTDSGYADARLKEIERWLSAHFYVMRDQTPSEEKTANAESKYQYKIGFMLFQSKHGQQAMLLDTDGNLAELSRRLEKGETDIVVSWMGEDYETENINN